MNPTPSLATPDAIPPRAGTGRFHFGDWLFRTVCQAAGLSVIVVSGLLVVMLVWEAWPTIRLVNELRVFKTLSWVPEPPEGKPQEYGIWAFVYGTIVTSIIAMLIGVPLGVGTAAFLAEIAPPWLRRVGSFLVELLAAIPSVVYGFWGLKFLAPAVEKAFVGLGAKNFDGLGLFSTGLILAVMIVPYITAITFDTCRA